MLLATGVTQFEEMKMPTTYYQELGLVETKALAAAVLRQKGAHT